MKNNFYKRAAAGVLAVALVAGTMPANVGGFLTGSTGIVAVADGDQVDFTKVADAEALKTAIYAGNSVQLAANIALTQTLVVSSDVTIDLNGNNITATDKRAIHVQQGTLTLTGTGTVSSVGNIDADSSVIRVGDGSSAAEHKAKAGLYIGTDVTITTDKCYGVTVFGGSTTETVDVHGKVVVTGTRSAISGNGNAWNSGTTINIYPGAVVSATQDVAIYHPQAGTLSITGGTISGLGGIEAKAGDATVSVGGQDTVITATANELYHNPSSNGTSTRGYAIVAVENKDYAGSPSFTISGGHINGPVGVVADHSDVEPSKEGTISITGGTFSTDPTAYVANDYVATEAEGSYTVEFNNVATIGQTQYASLQAAIDAAASGATVTLMKDVTTNVINIPSTANITLDLNGKTISGTYTIDNYGKLTINDTVGGGKVTGKYAVSAKANSVTIINGGIYEAQECAVAGFKTTSNASITINGGTFTTVDNSVFSFNGTSGANGNTLIVNGGTFNGNITSDGYVACGIYCPNNDVVTVNGGTFNITGGAGIVARAGNVTVTGGTFNCTGDAIGKVGDSRVVVPCSALVFDEVATYPGLNNESKITVTGGTFNAAVADVTAVNEHNSRISVSGGTFSDTLDASFIAEEYAQGKDGQVVAITALEYVIDADNTTITLDKDTTYGSITVAQGVKNAVIDLNGHNLTLTASGKKNGANIRSFMVNNGAELTVKNSGAAATVNAAAQSTIDNNAKFTVDEKVTLTCAANYTLYYKAGSTVNVKGTVANTHDTDGTAIGGNHDYSAGSTLNIEDGATVTSNTNNAIYHPQDGTINVNGGTITGKTAIYARAGHINIYDGTLNGTGNKAEAGTVANGADATGDALVLQVYSSSYPEELVPNITGGVFNSANGQAVATYQAKVNDSGLAPTKFITGGTFTPMVNAALIADTSYVDGDEVKVDDRTDISAAKVVLNYSSINYNASEISNSVYSVTLNGYELDSYAYTVEGTTFATEPGTYVIKIKGTGNFKGEATASWTIKQSYWISVEGGESNYYTNGQAATVIAPAPESGNQFSHWEVDGVKVSTNATYSFIVTKNVTLKPVYVPVAEEVKEEPVLTLSTFRTTYNNKVAIGFNFSRSVPAGYTVKEVGLLYGTNKLVGANTSVSGYANVDLSTTEGASVGITDLEAALKTKTTVKKFVGSSKSREGDISFTYGLGGNTVAYANAIGYIKAVDKNGKSVTLYSNAVATNYNSIS